jgi:hypothetical protein
VVMNVHQQLDSSRDTLLDPLRDRILTAKSVTPAFMSDVLALACDHLVGPDGGETAGRIRRCLRAEAWVDAALALVAAALPQWRICRIVHDDGEWYCELGKQIGKQWAVPEWLGGTVAATHEVLPLAILLAFIDASQDGGSETVAPARPLFLVTSDPSSEEPVCCDNFA